MRVKAIITREMRLLQQNSPSRDGDDKLIAFGAFQALSWVMKENAMRPSKVVKLSTPPPKRKAKR